jgi:hypothetical protein
VNYRCNLGVPAPYSLGDLPVSLRPFGLVRSGDDGFMWGTRRPLLRGKLRSEGGVKMTGKTSREPLWQVMGSPGRDLVIEMQCSL